MASTKTKRKLKTLSYKEKYEIIQFVDANPSMKRTDIAEKFGIARPTLYDLLEKNRQKIIDTIEKGETVATKKGTVKRIKHVSFEDVDSALLKWFHQVLAKPEIRVHGEMLLLKARKFAGEFGHKDADKIDDNWIDRFKARYDIGRVLKAGESGGVNTEIVAEWKQGKLKDICKRYNPKDIFNADETGLFYLMLPENTLGFKGQSHHGKKESRVRITLLVASNMDGSEKLPMYAIGKSKKPRAFKHVRSLPLPYSANKKAWMTSTLFDEWMRKLDRKMGGESRKICMVVDNCTAHPAYNYENIELVFLPPGTTSHTQPMDAGVIKNFKFHYRRLLATRRLNAIEAGTPFKWDLLDTMYAIKTAWGRVKQTTVANCFRSRGFVKDDDNGGEVEIEGNDVVDAVEIREFRNIWDRLSDFFGADVMPTMEEYVDVDSTDMGTQELSDAEIVESVRSTADNAPDDSGDEDVIVVGDAAASTSAAENPCPTIHEAFKAIDVLKRFASSVVDCPSRIFDLGDEYETFLQSEMPKRQRQTTIDEFFVSAGK